MAKDPAVLFYTSDFFVGTATMTDEQVGKYIRLLCLQHQQGRLTEKHMLSICKAYDEDVFCKFKIDADGLYYNERMEKEANLRKSYTESRKRNASKQKNDNKGTYAKHMQSICKTYAEHMENEDEDINEDVIDIKDINEDLQKERFNQFWQTYPRKVGKKEAQKSWSKIKPNVELFNRILSSVETAKKSRDWIKEQGQYIPHPTTWLNQGRWDDEIEVSSGNPFMDKLLKGADK